MLENGIILNSLETNLNDIFYKTKVYIFSKNEEGSIGFIVNKNSKYELIDAAPDMEDYNLPILYGGPVDDDKLFIVHNYPTVLSYDKIEKDICISSNFEELIKFLKLGIVNFSKIKLFMGYSGWDKSELEQEIENGYWEIGKPNDIFTN